MRDLSRSSLKILETLAIKNLDDRMNKHKIAEDAGLSYSRVYDGLENLRRRELVRIKKVRFKPRVYTITLGGLAIVLSRKPELWGKIDEIARKQAELLPSVFGRWDYFARAGVDGFLVTPLKRNFSSFTTPPRDVHIIGAEKSLRLNAVAEALWPEERLKRVDDGKRKAWIGIMIDDSDLLRFMGEYLKCLKEEWLVPREGALREINRARRALRSKKPELFARGKRLTRGGRFTRELGETAVMESREREKIRLRKQALLEELEKKSMDRFVSKKGRT